MKKTYVLTTGFTLLLAAIFLIYSCSKQGITTDPKAANKNLTATANPKSQVATSALTTNGTDTCGSCNKYFSATHAGTGFFPYPNIPLNLSCAANNTTVTLACVYYDVPNRFTIYDKNNNQIVTTGWVGDASCIGPWNPNPNAVPRGIHTNQATVYASFTYDASRAPYRMLVETSVSGCTACSTTSPDPGCSDQDDNWQVKISCVRQGTTCPTPPCTTIDTCKSCNKYYSATHAGIGQYTYLPRIPLDLTCQVPGKAVTVGCVYYDVPNRFTVYDKNGAVAATTGWVGDAYCNGPWNPSPAPGTTPGIHTNQAEVFMSFIYNTAIAPYSLEVNTTVVGCSGCSTHSPDPGCTDQDDNWQAHVMCITP